MAYDASKFKNCLGQLDFRKLGQSYDEDYIRGNINRVLQSSDTVIVAPTRQPEKVLIEPTDFIELNKTCGK